MKKTTVRTLSVLLLLSLLSALAAGCSESGTQTDDTGSETPSAVPETEPEPEEEEVKLLPDLPEDLDYDGVFDETLAAHCAKWKLRQVKTTNMGTLYELSYSIERKDPAHTQAFIDALRCRNGNLNISCGREAERDVM